MWLCVCVFVFVLDSWPVRSADRATLRSAKPSFHGWSPVFRTWLCPRKSFLSHWRGPPAFTLGKEELFFRETILVWKERGADYSPRPPTISPRRPLLTRMGCRGIPPAAEETCFFPGTMLLLKERGADFAFWLPTLPPGATPAYNDGLPTMPSGGRLWPTLPPNTTPAHKGRRRPAHPV